jgi:hypothetical protein
VTTRSARTEKTEEEMDDEAVVAYIRSFVTVMAADWRRRQLNKVLPEIMKQVDAARARGDAPNVHAIMQKVWLDAEGPAGLID